MAEVTATTVISSPVARIFFGWLTTKSAIRVNTLVLSPMVAAAMLRRPLSVPAIAPGAHDPFDDPAQERHPPQPGDAVTQIALCERAHDAELALTASRPGLQGGLQVELADLGSLELAAARLGQRLRRHGDDPVGSDADGVGHGELDLL